MKFSDKIIYLPTLKGKYIILYQRYSYSRVNGNQYLRCSKRKAGRCVARITLDTEGNIVQASSYTKHNHPPPSYIKSPDGMYFKVGWSQTMVCDSVSCKSIWNCNSFILCQYWKNIIYVTLLEISFCWNILYFQI